LVPSRESKKKGCSSREWVNRGGDERESCFVGKKTAKKIQETGCSSKERSKSGKEKEVLRKVKE